MGPLEVLRAAAQTAAAAEPQATENPPAEAPPAEPDAPATSSATDATPKINEMWKE